METTEKLTTDSIKVTTTRIVNRDSIMAEKKELEDNILTLSNRLIEVNNKIKLMEVK